MVKRYILAAVNLTILLLVRNSHLQLLYGRHVLGLYAHIFTLKLWVLQLWDRWSRPYIERIVQRVKAEHPSVPITLYANGSGGLLERLGSTCVDVVGLDWTIDMADARRRLGKDVSVQVR